MYAHTVSRPDSSPYEKEGKKNKKFGKNIKIIRDGNDLGENILLPNILCCCIIYFICMVFFLFW
jgi:hypothetical protein